jgi:hypothetical protein
VLAISQMPCSGISYAVVSWWGRAGSSSGDSQGWVGSDDFLTLLLRVTKARVPCSDCHSFSLIVTVSL